MAAHHPLPDLDDLVAEVDRTCTTANLDGAAQPDWLALLEAAATVAARLRAVGDDLVEEYVEHCRLQGASYEAIGVALSAAGDSAATRFATAQTLYRPEEIAGELRAAMHQMKAEAVRHSNNFVGTEHVLAGLLAAECSATQLLEAHGARPERLAAATEASFSIGASAPARRIAWTPYARRALAIAKSLADEAGGGPIGCDHLLVGLARLGTGLAARILVEGGVDLHRLGATAAGTSGQAG